MILRIAKYAGLGVGGMCLLAGILFGRDAYSYLTTSARSVQAAVKDAVPTEFELQRARDMLDDIIPQMHANIRLIAQEEVQINDLKNDLAQSDRAMAEEKVRLTKLRDTLTVRKASYAFGGQEYTHEQVKDELSRAFERIKEAEVVYAGKQRLLETRAKSLQAAMTMLDKTRAQKARLEDQIQGLESQYRLVQAAAVGSHVQIDNSKLAQAEKLISQIKQKLDVAERVLAHEAKFVQPIAVDVIDEKDLVAQVDAYLAPAGATTQPSAVALAADQE